MSPPQSITLTPQHVAAQYTLRHGVLAFRRVYIRE